MNSQATLEESSSVGSKTDTVVESDEGGRIVILHQAPIPGIDENALLRSEFDEPTVDSRSVQIHDVGFLQCGGKDGLEPRNLFAQTTISKAVVALQHRRRFRVIFIVQEMLQVPDGRALCGICAQECFEAGKCLPEVRVAVAVEELWKLISLHCTHDLLEDPLLVDGFFEDYGV